MEKEYVMHEGEKYLVISPASYCREHSYNAFVASKFAKITARKGRVGEKVDTIMKNGLLETSNVVTYDPSTGEPDWVVTQESGEQMIVNDTKFKNLYHLNQEVKEGEKIKPSGVHRPMIWVDENVAFKTNWGEMQYIRKNGVLVAITQDDIYGIQKEEFLGSYNFVKEENGKESLEKNLSKKSFIRRPQIFLSVAFPYDNLNDFNFMKQVVERVNAKGIKAVNIKKIDDKNVNLVNEIKSALEESEGILSLAFNKSNNSTSPFIQIETALASALNLETLMLVPDTVEKEGMLYEDNVDGNIETIKKDADLYSQENKEVLKLLDGFIEKVLNRYDMKLNDKDLAKFKSAFMSGEKRDELLNYLKSFYNVKENGFDLDDIYVKRPFEIKAFAVDKDGFYNTQDGKVFLKKGDFLVCDIDENVMPYSIKKEDFKARYITVNGKKDTYITKFIPTVAKEKGDKMEVFGLINTSDKYQMDKNRFILGYQSLKEYILNLQNYNEIDDEYINEL